MAEKKNPKLTQSGRPRPPLPEGLEQELNENAAPARAADSVSAPVGAAAEPDTQPTTDASTADHDKDKPSREDKPSDKDKRRELGSVTVAMEGSMPGGQVMAATSEEFRESLQTLQGSLELLIAGKVPDARSAKKFLGIAYRETEYLNNRVGDLQLASTIESGKLRLKLTGLDLNGILQTVTEKLSPAAVQSEIEIELTQSEELLTIRGDESLLRMLLTNLVERCIKATPPGGKVTITHEPVGEFVEIRMLSQDANAPEFTEIHHNQAAERRLALYISEQIAYAHEGSLAFRGINQEVREVTLNLPMQLKGRGRGKILVVDDNPQAATLLVYALEEEGFEAVKALNGLEGLKLAKSERVDLVILDILLPGIDGFEVCHRLRAAPETASTPVIMISAKSRDEDRATALRIGADAYFGKPLGMSELMKAIENLLEENDTPGWSPN